jgi:hypothetical protein
MIKLYCTKCGCDNSYFYEINKPHYCKSCGTPLNKNEVHSESKITKASFSDWFVIESGNITPSQKIR